MNDLLPGHTDWETHEYLRDHGHRVAAAQAYRYIARVLETDPAFPLPASAETVIAEAAAAMRDVHAAREARVEAYFAGRLAAMHAAVDEDGDWRAAWLWESAHAEMDAALAAREQVAA